MATLRTIDKSLGHYLKGSLFRIDKEWDLVQKTNPMFNTEDGVVMWKLRTNVTDSWLLRDDIKFQNLIKADTYNDIITFGNDYRLNKFETRVINQSTNYAASDGDFVLMTCGATDKTITLPVASSNINAVVEVKLVDNDTGNLIVSASGSDLIDGAAFKTYTTQYAFSKFHSDGTNWFIK